VLAAVLFTDFVGSTERVAEMGDSAWSEIIETHERIARKLVDRYLGRYVKSTGDGVLATFDGPGRATACALALRDELRLIGITIRAGIHVGEVEVQTDDVGGIAVHVAARVLGKAADGEVWASRTVKDLVAGSVLMFEDRGVHVLKGIAEEWQLFAVTGR
jgi:class 3 adenylate cyclase